MRFIYFFVNFGYSTNAFDFIKVNINVYANITIHVYLYLQNPIE